MTDSLKILVIGGGFAGMAAALRLAHHGMAVDLIERDPSWNSSDGSGISLSGPTLRALNELGVLDAVLARGAAENDCDLRLGDGTILQHIKTPAPAPGVPGGGAIMRPLLARIMAGAVREANVNVAVGTTYSELKNSDNGVTATLTDGRTTQYDLVVGADGLYSGLRKRFWPEAGGPQFTGQGVWRATVPRPKHIERVHMFLGNDGKAGINPVSDSHMYLFFVENRGDTDWVADETAVTELKALLADFSAPELVTIRENLDTDADVNYRPLESLLVDLPWHKQRIVLIGDAVHATTPHLASGAGIGIEAGLVLADELAERGNESIETALKRFQTRRWERSRLVIENSLRLGELERNHGSKQEQSEIMSSSMRALAEAI